ncbi:MULTISPECIES: hypothetical protein [unclassified Streptomyces]|uniref:hypothetical protein n=1 Tax=unclassified Streptomyces TaxID=2593676 RepID=UPI001F0BD5D3|nr:MULTISPECIES: hypothetical protein [unclassified Streptomyces]
MTAGPISSRPAWRPQQVPPVQAIDDCIRLRVLKIYPTLNQATAIQFVDYVLQRLPFQVEVIQTDNGAEFQSVFHFHVLDKGIGHAYIRPRTPRLNGKVERSHRKSWLDGAAAPPEAGPPRWSRC